jgi:hypothetical protein
MSCLWSCLAAPPSSSSLFSFPTSTRLLPYFNPPAGGTEYFLYLSVLTVILGGVAVLRRERGAIGAAAAVAATGAASVIVFMLAFPFVISWLLGILMPD